MWNSVFKQVKVVQGKLSSNSAHYQCGRADDDGGSMTVGGKVVNIVDLTNEGTYNRHKIFPKFLFTHVVCYSDFVDFYSPVSRHI